MKIPINQQLIDVLEELDLDVDEGILFCFAVEYDLLRVLIDKELITERNEHEFRINLTTMDENGNIILKYSLFSFKNNSDEQFKEFITRLKDRGLEINGFSYNSKPHAILTTDTETKENFSKFIMKHPDFNLDKLVEVTLEYYQKVDYAKKLSNFLNSDVETMYE